MNKNNQTVISEDEVVFEGKKTGKLTAKDLIYAGAFAALYFIGMLATVAIFGTSPVTYFIAPLVVGIVCATIYITYVSKVQKFGAILILSAIFCIVFISSAGVLVLIALAAGILSEGIASRGGYKSKKMISASYMSFNLVMLMPYIQLIFMTDTWVELTAEYSGQAYADSIVQMLDVVGSWMVIIIAVLAILGALIGGLLANKLFRKHFEKAGLV